MAQLKDYLLAERERALKEVADIESLLISRCGWKRPEVSIASIVSERAKQKGSVSEIPDSRPQIVPAGPFALGASDEDEETGDIISYIDEALEFLKDWPDERPFKLVHFRDFLLSRHSKVNEQSMRGPFQKFVKKGELKIVRPGLGRAPVVYGKIPKPTAADDSGLDDDL